MALDETLKNHISEIGRKKTHIQKVILSQLLTLLEN